MPFLGYYPATTAEITEVGYPPLSPVAVVDDTVVAVWQDTETFVRTCRWFKYVNDPQNGLVWAVEGSIVLIENVMSHMLPFEGRYLSVLDPNGLGMFATNFAYVDTVDMTPPEDLNPGVPVYTLVSPVPWSGSKTVGQSVLAYDSYLEIHDIFTGAEVANIPSTLGQLPIYIRSNSVVVGVGSAVYSDGHWVILWYKMAISSGAAPRVVYDTATILETNEFLMIGNTTGYTLTLWDNHTPSVSHIIEGVFDDVHTRYNFTDYDATWVFFTVTDGSQHVIYSGRRGATDATYRAPTTGPLNDLSLTAAIKRINEIFMGGGDPVTINHAI